MQFFQKQLTNSVRHIYTYVTQVGCEKQVKKNKAESLNQWQY